MRGSSRLSCLILAGLPLLCLLAACVAPAYVTEPRPARHVAPPPLMEIAGSYAGEMRLVPLGMSVARLTPDLRARFGLAADAQGLLVTRLEPGGVAVASGVQAGDVLRAYDGIPADRWVAQGAGIGASAQTGQAFALTLWRGGQDITVMGVSR